MNDKITKKYHFVKKSTFGSRFGCEGLIETREVIRFGNGLNFLRLLVGSIEREQNATQRERQLLKGFQSLGLSKVALPKGYYIPPHVTQFQSVLLVTLTVAAHLVLPELAVSLGFRGKAAVLVAMPETAIHINHSVIAPQHNVGRAR